MRTRSGLTVSAVVAGVLAATTAGVAIAHSPAHSVTSASRQDVALAAADGVAALAAADLSSGQDSIGEKRWHRGDRHHLLTDAQRTQLRSTGHLVFTRDTKRHGTVTVDLQLGQLTEVTNKSLTVRSPAGYTHTYAVDDTMKVRVRRQLGSVSQLRTGLSVVVISVTDSAGKHRVRVMVRHNGPRQGEHAKETSTTS